MNRTLILGNRLFFRTGPILLLLLFSLESGAHAVGAATATSTTLSVTPGMTISQGTALTLQAAVSAGGSPVTGGSVTFYDGARVLTVVQVVYAGSTYAPGTANCKLFLGPGSHSLLAVYAGTASFLPSTSVAASVTVAVASSAVTTTAITSSGSAGNYTLQGAVTAYSAIAPTGNVSFTDQSNNNFALGTAALDAATRTSGWQTFTPSPTASPNYAVILGDLNGDGIPDLITSNYGGSTVSVFLGNGDGTFRTHVDYSVGGFSFGMALGDLNGDGFPDLAVAAHNASTVQVLLGNGDGTFQAAQSFTTAGTSQYVVMADFNRDGILDLATCSSGGSSISILLGNGDGTFKTEQSFGTGGFTYGIVAGDFNKDGFIDLAVSNNDSNTISIFLGNGDGTFQAQSDSTVDSSPTTIAAADLNADGNLDLVVGNQSTSSISVLLGNGDGTFQAKAGYSGFNNPWGVAIADVNSDGIPDVVVASPSAHAVEVFPGKGDGTLLPPVTTSTGVTNYIPAVGDLNGDGVPDIAVPNIVASNLLVALGSISVTATQAAVSIPGADSHNIVASYLGNSSFAFSTSASISLTGTPFTTVLSLNVAPTSGAPEQVFVLTANLSPASSSGYTAGGTVTFADGNATLGSPVNVVNGTASLSKSDFSLGSHTITASYSGDTNFTASTSAPITATIAIPPDYAITANPSALTVKRGATGTSVLTITPTGGFTGQVAFTCAGLPQFTACSFVPASVMLPGDDATHTIQFSLVTPVATATSSLVLVFMSPLGVLILLPRRFASFRCILVMRMFLVAALLLMIPGCGSSSTPQVPLGTSTVVMTGTAVGGSAHHSANIVVTITQ